MNIRKLFFISILLFGSLLPVVRAAEISVSKLDEKTVRLTGARSAIYSPSGRFLAVQSETKFLILPTDNLDEVLKNPFERAGKIIGFLPSSEALLYSSNGAGGEVFLFEPAKQSPRRIFSAAVSKNMLEAPGQNDIVIVSDELIVAGGGSYDWGGEKGNIYRYNPKTGRAAKGAQVWAFWYAMLSPTRRYILYEHGAESNNNADLYDTAQNRNYPLRTFFNLRREFPKLDATDEMPIAWLAGRDRFVAEISPQEETAEEVWLVLFDVPTRRIVWKKPVGQYLFPSDFQQIDDKKALLAYEDSVYELSLTDGEMRKNAAIEGQPFAVSRSGKMVAFVKENQIYTISFTGENKKMLFELPARWKPQTAYKGMGEKAPVWSPDGKQLILFGENQLLITRP